MTQTGSMGLISAAHLSRGTPGRNSKIMGDLAPFDKAGSGRGTIGPRGKQTRPAADGHRNDRVTPAVIECTMVAWRTG
jgi:hypothetical protein